MRLFYTQIDKDIHMCMFRSSSTHKKKLQIFKLLLFLRSFDCWHRTIIICEPTKYITIKFLRWNATRRWRYVGKCVKKTWLKQLALIFYSINYYQLYSESADWTISMEIKLVINGVWEFVVCTYACVLIHT